MMSDVIAGDRNTRRSRSAVGLRALFGAALAALIPAGCGSSGGAKRDGGGTDVGTLPGGDAATGGPIVATAGTWTWIPFPDAVCADGSTTGIGVNLGAAGARPLIYLEGGGACWSEETCYTEMTAANFVSGYSAATFAPESGPTGALATPGSFFDRSATANPFKDYSFVYVPYCTGDAHAGNNVVRYGTHTAHHVGFKNFAAYLNRLVPTFSGADRVILAGSSAGQDHAIGAGEGWDQPIQIGGEVLEADVVRGVGAVPDHVVAGVRVAGAVGDVDEAIILERVGRGAAVEEAPRRRQRAGWARLEREGGGRVPADEVGRGHLGVASLLAPAGAAALEVDERARARGAQVHADAGGRAVGADRVRKRDPGPGAGGRHDRPAGGGVAAGKRADVGATAVA